MRISIWQQWSSNHSSMFTIMGTFESEELAQTAARKISELSERITQFIFEDLADADFDRYWKHELLTPFELELETTHQIGLAGRIDWFSGISISQVGRVVMLSPDQTWQGPLPVDKLLEQMGARVVIEGDLAPGNRLDNEPTIRIRCKAPDEQPAQQIMTDAGYKSDGDYLERTLTSFRNDAPTVEYVHYSQLADHILWLKQQGCEDVHFEIIQARDNDDQTLVILGLAESTDVLRSILSQADQVSSKRRSQEWTLIEDVFLYDRLTKSPRIEGELLSPELAQTKLRELGFMATGVEWYLARESAIAVDIRCKASDQTIARELVSSINEGSTRYARCRLPKRYIDAPTPPRYGRDLTNTSIFSVFSAQAEFDSSYLHLSNTQFYDVKYGLPALIAFLKDRGFSGFQFDVAISDEVRFPMYKWWIV